MNLLNAVSCSGVGCEFGKRNPDPDPDPDPSGALRHSVGVFQLIFGTQYFCLFGSLDESMLKILV